jgi:hypothetical protein
VFSGGFIVFEKTSAANLLFAETFRHQLSPMLQSIVNTNSETETIVFIVFTPSYMKRPH